MNKTLPLLLLLLLLFSACSTVLTRSIEGDKVQLSPKELIIPAMHKINCTELAGSAEVMKSLKEAQEEVKDPGFSLRYQKETRDSLWAFELSQSSASPLKVELSIYDEEGYELLCNYEIELSTEAYINAVLVRHFPVGAYIAKFENTETAAAFTATFERRE